MRSPDYNIFLSELCWGLHGAQVAFLLLTWVRFKAFPKSNFNFAQIYCRHLSEESTVDRGLKMSIEPVYYHKIHLSLKMQNVEFDSTYFLGLQNGLILGRIT